MTRSTPDVHELTPSDVAVIVAARDEQAHIRACVDSILTGAREAEIIVVDDGSTDETPQILQSYGNQIRVLQGEGKGPARARNEAIKSTQKPYVAFADADCIVDQAWLETLCQGLTGRPKAFASIGGAQLLYPKAGWRERRIAKFLESVGFVSDYVHGSQPQEVLHNPTCNVLYLKEIIQRVNGFDEALWPTEDLDLDLTLRKLGYRSLYLPSAKVEHRRPTTFLGFGKMMKRYGFSHAQLVKKRGLCQPLHHLSYMAPFGLAFFLGLILFNASFALSLSMLLLLATSSFFTVRNRSLLSGFVFTGLLVWSLVAWIFGFYKGLPGPLRISKDHV